jgi:hypothetical protein
MKDQAEDVTGLELDPFFEVFFREISYPVLNVVRGINEANFTWETESNVLLDLDIPIRVNGTDQIVEMTDGQGSADISINDNLVIDPEQWILMADPVIVTSLNGDVTEITDYRLEQNYPNPFNPKTQITYSIPKAEIVKIKVYDILGKEIKTLLNDYQPAGIYEIDFDGTGLQSGVYFYRIISGSYADTKKMILLK